MVVTVLRPLAAQRAHERTELSLDRASRQIAALYDPYDLSEIARVLRENRPAARDAFLLLSAWDGRLVATQPIGPDLRARIIPLLLSSGLADSSALRDSSAGEAPFGRSGDDFASLEARLAVLGHRAVNIEGGRFGEVVAMGTAEGVSLWALPETRALALFMPFAILAAGVAGLLMVRIVVTRLQALEQVARRVTGGELSARVERSGRDEIGRLEQSFNLMTERLAVARAQLEATDLQRRRLFADITHELATPLTSIRGYVETLANPEVPSSEEERATYLNDVLEEAKRLELLIADLLELTRLEAGSVPLKPVRLDWAALCRHAARRLGPRFSAAGLTLEWAGLETPAWVLADGRRLEQVVDNLLGNALRYVPAGGHVTLSMARLDPVLAGHSTDRPAAGWGLTVSDDGPGIASEDLPHVFERFYRAESVHAQGGTGLGLAIVREIASQHGGRVHAESRQPRGAAFIVELPSVE